MSPRHHPWFGVFVLAFVGLLYFGPDLSAQPGVIATFPGRLSRLDPKEPFRKLQHRSHEITLSQGRTYVISMTSTQFDTYLMVLDVNGRRLAFDDDSGEGTNARVNFTPPRTGLYRLIASTYSAVGQGNYVITVAPTGTGLGTLVLNVESHLTAGDPLVGNHYTRSYLVQMVSGRRFQIDLMSSEFDTYLKLLNPIGTEVAFDDDGGVGTNARIVYVPPSNGYYRIIVTSWTPRATGAFHLTVHLR